MLQSAFQYVNRREPAVLYDIPARLAGAGPAKEAGDEAHDLLFENAQHLRSVVNVPQLDLLGPGREALLQQQVFGVLHLRRHPSDGIGGLDAHRLQRFHGLHCHWADVVDAPLHGQPSGRRLPRQPRPAGHRVEQHFGEPAAVVVAGECKLLRTKF